MNMKKLGFIALFTLSTSVSAAQNFTWEYHMHKDPITDVQRYTAGTGNTDGALLLIQCSADNIVVVVQTDPFDIGIKGTSKEVAYRFDRNEPFFSTWVRLTKGAGALGDEARQFARMAMDGNQVTVRSDRDTVTFTLKGSRKALHSLAGDCPQFSL